MAEKADFAARAAASLSACCGATSTSRWPHRPVAESASLQELSAQGAIEGHVLLADRATAICGALDLEVYRGVARAGTRGRYGVAEAKT